MKIIYIALGALGLIVAVVIISMYIPATVKTGEQITCRVCNKVFKDSVEEIKVPTKDVNKYKILQSSGMCDVCANEIIKVETGEIIRCEKCGNILQKKIKTIEVQRKDSSQYTVKEVRRGICAISPQRIIGNWVKSNGYKMQILSSICKCNSEGFKKSYGGDFSLVSSWVKASAGVL